ncbi:MAG: hypothetical protein ACOC95_02180 [Planctomycetota bacterium]
MKTSLTILALTVVAATLPLRAAEPLPPIKTVTIGDNREIRVNGEPFFPIMSWAQANRRYGLLGSLNFNTFTGGGSGPAENLEVAQQAGGYVVTSFDPDVKDHPRLLGWLHGDEPDMPTARQDVELEAPGMDTQNLRRLGRLFDGDTETKAALEPLDGLVVTATWPEPKTVTTFRLHQGNEGDNRLVQIKTIELLADGRPVAAATLDKRTGPQDIPLEAPVTFTSLTLRVKAIYPGEGVEGYGMEVEGLNAEGTNVLATPSRRMPKRMPEVIIEDYRKIKASGSTRPVFTTFTSAFMSTDTRIDEAAKKKYYPEYLKGIDVAGFDFYPIYGWNKPEWITRVALGTEELVEMAGKRPVYAWIETHKGSRWITYSRQIDVEPRHTRAEVWMAIIRGATAIGYFTHAWRPEFTEFAPTEAMRAELKRLNGQITRLAPAILAPKAKVRITMNLTGEPEGHYKATIYDGALWIFAQNLDRQQGAKATFAVKGLPAGAAIEVVDENRTLRAADGTFTDRFDPLAEHIYRIRR